MQRPTSSQEGRNRSGLAEIRGKVPGPQIRKKDRYRERIETQREKKRLQKYDKAGGALGRRERGRRNTKVRPVRGKQSGGGPVEASGTGDVGPAGAKKNEETRWDILKYLTQPCRLPQEE